jgi:hypothetical protein
MVTASGRFRSVRVKFPGRLSWASVSHRGIADQALAAWVPTVKPQHVGGDCRLVDKYEVGRIKKALLPNPASARAGDVGALALCRPQTFF